MRRVTKSEGGLHALLGLIQSWQWGKRAWYFSCISNGLSLTGSKGRMVKNVRRQKSRGLNELTRQISLWEWEILLLSFGRWETCPPRSTVISPKKSRRSWEWILCFAVLFFNCCPTHLDVFIFLWVPNRIWSPETQNGKSHMLLWCWTGVTKGNTSLLLSWVRDNVGSWIYSLPLAQL